MLREVNATVLTHIGLDEVRHLLNLKRCPTLIETFDKAVKYAEFLKHRNVTLDHVICAILTQLDEEKNFILSAELASEPCRNAILNLLSVKQYLEWVKQRGEPQGTTTYASIAVFDFIYEIETKGISTENGTLILLKKILEKSYSMNISETPELFSHYFSKVEMLQLINNKLAPPKPEKPRQTESSEETKNVQDYLNEISKRISSHGTAITFTDKASKLIIESCSNTSDPVEVLTQILLKPISSSLDLESLNCCKITQITIGEAKGQLKFIRKSRTIL